MHKPPCFTLQLKQDVVLLCVSSFGIIITTLKHVIGLRYGDWLLQETMRRRHPARQIAPDARQHLYQPGPSPLTITHRC